MQVIRLATLDGATFLKDDKNSGSIEVGKVADLLIVSGKPDTDIEQIRNVEIVFRNGIGYDPRILRKQAVGLVGRY